MDEAFKAGPFKGAVRWVVPLADGRILIAGDFSAVGSSPRPGLARLRADGSLDESFNPSTAPWRGTLVAIAAAPDDRVLVGGFNVEHPPGARTNHIIRLESGGALDAGFRSPEVPATGGPMEAMDVTPTGSILMASRAIETVTSPGGSFNTGVSRVVQLDPFGQRDAGFEEVTFLDPASMGYARCRQILAHPSGEFTVSWISTLFAPHRGALSRHRADGTAMPYPSALLAVYLGQTMTALDPEFLAAEADGSVVVSGLFKVDGAPPRPWIWNREQGYQMTRLLPDGRWDGRFLVKDWHLDPGFCVEAGGRVVGSLNGRLLRLNTGGVPDPYWISLPISNAVVRQQSDGRFLVAGKQDGRDVLVRVHGRAAEPGPPSIRSLLPLLTINESHGTLSVWAEGDPTHYQWRRNGEDIPGETRDAIFVRTDTPALYSVVVSNQFGAVTSQEVAARELTLGHAVNAPELTWTRRHVVVATDFSRDGIASARGQTSFGPGDPQEAVLRTTVTGPGLLSFWGAGSDVAFQALGRVWWYSFTTNWSHVEVPIPAHTHELTWSTPSSAFFDPWYVDEVVYRPNQPGAPGELRRDTTVGEGGTEMKVSLPAMDPSVHYQWYRVRTPPAAGFSTLLDAIPGATNASLVVGDPGALEYLVIATNAMGAGFAGPSTPMEWSQPQDITLRAERGGGLGREWRLSIRGRSGWRAMVQRSSDLVRWADVQEVVCTGQFVLVNEDAEPSGEAQYFRAVVRAPASAP